MMIAGYCFIAAAAMGVWLIVRGVRGVPVLSMPRCRACGYDLRGYAETPPTRCSECGADLSRTNAVLFGSHERRPRQAWAGLALLVGVGLLWGGLRVGRQMVGMFFFPPLPSSALSPTPASQPLSESDYPTASPADLLTMIPVKGDSNLLWSEFENRLDAGRLTSVEIDAAIDALCAWFETGHGRGSTLIYGGRFLAKAESAHSIDTERVVRLTKAFIGQPKAVVRPIVREGIGNSFSIDSGHAESPIEPYAFVKAIRSVSVDSGTVKLSAEEFSGRDGYASGRYPINAVLTIDAPPGLHTVRFLIDAALMFPNSLKLSEDPGPSRDWPEARARWMWTVSTPINVVAPDASIAVRLVSDPAFDPQTHGQLTVQDVRIVTGEKAPVLKVKIECGGKLIAQCYTLVVHVGDRTYPAQDFAANFGGGMSNDIDVELPPNLSRDLITATLIFTPTPDDTGIRDDRIWGRSVTFANVPMKRWDVNATTSIAR